MYALFDDAGKFHAGRVMAEAESSMQIELDSGKRVKAKSANVLMKFDKPAPAELLAQAQVVALEIDLDLAWEFAPQEEFGFADLAREYFDAHATPVQQAAGVQVRQRLAQRTRDRGFHDALALGRCRPQGGGPGRALGPRWHLGRERPAGQQRQGPGHAA